MQGSLPLYRHPTITVMIEGAKEAADGLWAQLDPALMPHVIADPMAARADIEASAASLEQVGAPVVLRGCDGTAVASDPEDRLTSIYRYIAGPQRFCAPAVIVIKYDSAARGMVACEEVSHVPGKKVWYTVGKNGAQGIDAFNRDWIDRFVRNDLATSVRQLEDEIVALQNKYFLECTLRLGGAMLDMETYRFLRDPAFASLVADLADRYGFVEHYLFCAPSGLLFFDAHAKPTLMVVQTEESMVRQFEHARGLDVPAELLQDLFECRVVPCFLAYDRDARDGHVGQVVEHFRPASICEGESDYYWALFDLPAALRKAAPFSHAQFMRDYSAVA